MNLKPVEGCGQYWRLMWQATQATDRSQTFYFSRMALQHKETCPKCIALNTPLEVQLFGKDVKVTA